MSIEEELQEHAEHAREPLDKKVAATMAVLAAVLAIVSVLGHLATTEEIVDQQRASDQWSYYQAKTIRRYESEIARDLLVQMQNVSNAKTATSDGAGKADSHESDYAANVTRYAKDAEEIQAQAKELEDESHVRGRQALRVHLGEVFVEVGIVLASLAILTKRKGFWWASLSGGVIGAAVAATAIAIR